jgi:hypothetical protein
MVKLVSKINKIIIFITCPELEFKIYGRLKESSEVIKLRRFVKIENMW